MNKDKWLDRQEQWKLQLWEGFLKSEELIYEKVPAQLYENRTLYQQTTSEREICIFKIDML